MSDNSIPASGARATRRQFLKGSLAAAAALGFPTIIPASALGADGAVAPSNRITMGCIGLGGMGTNDMRAFLAQDDVQVLAVCDVNRSSGEYGHWFKLGWQGANFGREPGRLIVNEHYAQQRPSGKYAGCAAYSDFRELIARDDIDAVTVVTPDHWHAVIAIAAAKTGKHIYCEKPMTLTLNEGKAMIQAVRRHGVTFQTGSHERSNQGPRFMCELVRNGHIGKVQRIIVNVGPTHREGPASTWEPMPIPDGFDYDMWLGPAPWAPYHKDRCLYNFRFLLDYSGGNLTNYGAHSVDLAQWGMGADATGPVEIKYQGGGYPKDGLFDASSDVRFTARYASGTELVCRTAKPDVYVRFEGTEGWVDYQANGAVNAEPASLLRTSFSPGEIRLPVSTEHHRNFIDAIRSGQDPVAPVEAGHRSASVCHLGNICMQLGRDLKWDPEKEEFPGDEQANRLLSRPMRGPWRLA